jgi:NAD(P)-dependent dehydrogenase (short-subunit alcohol dehydrogenase family)
MDLGSTASVRRAAAAINNETEKIDILINNAAIMASPYATTDDGIESQFATNYLGHFLLTNLLMAKLLLAAPGARVVNLTSTAGLMGEINWDDINFKVSVVRCAII